MILQGVEIATAVALGLPALVREGLTWSDLRVQALSSAPVHLDPHPQPRPRRVKRERSTSGVALDPAAARQQGVDRQFR